MRNLKLLGIVLLVLAPLAGIILQTRWGLLASGRPAQMVSQSTTREPDTVVDVTNYVAYEAKVRWWLVLLLSAVFAAGIVCLCIASIRSARIQP
jgi:hypothetical protein